MAFDCVDVGLIDPEEAVLEDEAEEVLEVVPVLDLVAVDGADEGQFVLLGRDHQLHAVFARLDRESHRAALLLVLQRVLGIEKVPRLTQLFTNPNHPGVIFKILLLDHQSVTPQLLGLFLIQVFTIIVALRVNIPKHFKHVEELVLVIQVSVLDHVLQLDRLLQVFNKLLAQKSVISFIHKFNKLFHEKAKGLFSVG